MHKDLIIYISQYLSNNEKIYLSTTSSSLNSLKYEFIYDDCIAMDTVSHLSYYNNFASIKTNRLDKLFPVKMKYLHLTVDHNTCDPVKNPIPNSVTHLTLMISDATSENYEVPTRAIGNYITNSVTHFTLHLNTTYIKRQLMNTPMEFTCLRKNNPELFETYPESIISVTTYMGC
uniref:Uncharacterized protein n=1 Tax=viral metagenome TaxID=1070528 RepID=A0A6C0C806_9ZZZZ